MIKKIIFINTLATVTFFLTYSPCFGMSSSSQAHARFRCMKKPGAQAIIVAPNQAIQQSIVPTHQAARADKTKIAPEAKVQEYMQLLCTLPTRAHNGENHATQEIVTLEKALLSCGTDNAWKQTGLMLLMAQAQQLQEHKETQPQFLLSQRRPLAKDISADSNSVSQEKAHVPTEAELQLFYENFLKSPRRNHSNNPVQAPEQKMNGEHDQATEYGVVDHIISEEQSSNEATTNKLIQDHLTFLDEHKQ